MRHSPGSCGESRRAALLCRTLSYVNGLCSITVASPTGPLTLVGGEQGLAAILWAGERAGRVVFGQPVTAGPHPVLAEAEQQLCEYFAGTRESFDLPLDPRGTAFQLRVWAALREIPFGETRSYGQLARALGDSKLTRALGAANGRNPLSIVVPCHRVIGAGGSLTGFAGGLEAKQFLLHHESREMRLFPETPG